MGLPVYQVNSNLHAFTHKIGEQRMGYFALWSCALSLEKAIKKYYASSSNEYEEIKNFSKYMKDFDMAEFCESYLVPLIQTESMEFIVDGCQYRRTLKTENISDWDIAQKYLNVCVNSEDGSNCSKCSKCMRTMIPLDAMGKLDKFSDVFNFDVYHKYAFRNKAFFRANVKRIGFAMDIVDYCDSHSYAMPSTFVSKIYLFLRKCGSRMKRVLRS